MVTCRNLKFWMYSCSRLVLNLTFFKVIDPGKSMSMNWQYAAPEHISSILVLQDHRQMPTCRDATDGTSSPTCCKRWQPSQNFDLWRDFYSNLNLTWGPCNWFTGFLKCWKISTAATAGWFSEKPNRQWRGWGKILWQGDFLGHFLWSQIEIEI